MSIENHVTLTGNLTADPELTYTDKGGRALTKFTLACNRRYQENGEWKSSEPEFFDIVVWNGIGENIAASASKGQRVTVTGRVHQRRWQTAEGENRSAVDIVADEVSVSVRFGTTVFAKNPPAEKVA